MKNFLSLLIILIISVSCDTTPKALEHLPENCCLTLSQKTILRDFDTLSKPAQYVIQGDQLFIRTDQNLTYTATILSGTDRTTILIGFFIPLIIIFIAICIILIVMAFDR